MCVWMSAGVCLYVFPLPCGNTKHQSVERALMCLWRLRINHMCVSVCVFRGAGGVCPLCTPTAATRLATCSGIREHADYTRHNGDTQTQICPRPTKDTHRTAPTLITFSIFNIFIVWRNNDSGRGARHDRWCLCWVMLLERCGTRDFELWINFCVCVCLFVEEGLLHHSLG